MAFAIMAAVAATVNVLMASYNLGKDVYCFGKEKVGRSKKFENYKENVEWKRKTLLREKAIVGQDIDKFETRTIGLYNQWVERVDKAEAQLNQYLDRCENAKGFCKRAKLVEKGSILRKEIDKLEADGKIFYDPRRNRTQQSSSVSRQTHKGSSFKRSVALTAETSSYISRQTHRTSSEKRSFALPGDASSRSSSSWNSKRSSSSGSCTSVPSSAASRSISSIGLTGSRDSSRSSNSSSWNRGCSRRRSCISVPSTAASRNTGSIGLTGSRDSSRNSSSGNVSPTWSTRAVSGRTRSSQLLMESTIRYTAPQRTISMMHNRAELLSALAMPR